MTAKFDLWSGSTTLRGANMVYRERIPVFDGGPGSEFVPQYEAGILQALRAAGANVVVLSMPGPYGVEPPYGRATHPVRLLDELIDMAEDAGLFVVLSFRTAPGRNETDINDFLPVPVARSLYRPNDAAQAAFVQMWQFVATRCVERPSVVGYDLLVEPHSLTDGSEDEDLFRANWRQLCQQTIAAIRAVDEDTPILVEPASWASPAALAQWQMPNGSKLVASVHQYEPFAYTQGQLAAGAAFDFALTEQAYGQVDGFKLAFPGVPVAVTEFGVKHTAAQAADFLARQLDLIEARSCNHMIWAWGEDSDDFDVRSAVLLPTLQATWAKNTVFL